MASVLPAHRVRVPVNVQEWHSLFFLHWPVDSALVRAAVPAPLEVDTFDGVAWLGVTPFVMRRVRVPGAGLPLVRDFVEVNVRTYVRAPDGTDGVWFFSLDCDRLSVVAALRALGLPYRYSVMATRRAEASHDYAVLRHGERLLRVRARPGAPLADEALLTFLTGRWNAYTSRFRRLWRVPVEHEKWPLHAASARVDANRLLSAAALPDRLGDPMVHFSPRVTTRIGAPRPL